MTLPFTMAVVDFLFFSLPGPFPSLHALLPLSPSPSLSLSLSLPLSLPLPPSPPASKRSLPGGGVSSKDVKARYEKQLGELRVELKTLKLAKKEHSKALKKNVSCQAGTFCLLTFPMVQ